MDELIRQCVDSSKKKNYLSVVNTASKIVSEAIKEVISGHAVEREYKEIVSAVEEVVCSNTGSRYKNTEHSEACALLGKIFETGILTDKSLKKAFLYYKTAAEYNSPFGCYRLAHFYEHGIECSKDMHKAAHFYKMSANGGCCRGMHRYGMLLLEGGPSCRQNIKNGVFHLEQAKKLATAHYPDPIFDLALCYEEIPLVQGQIIPDPEYALKLYMEGESLGCPRSCVRLGNAYHYGELGVEPSLETAASYYQKAEHASGEACFELHKIFKKTKNAEESNRWLKKASELGHPDGIRAHAKRLEMGDGGPKDTTLALWWYKIAQTKGINTSSDIKRCRK
ncbi:uncharacterized protein NECID01_1042 [Nematocida sp. AWRm77]|nr:uncharacterized protein NECID01_1042 [Nematocida sp. AWRm77]